MNRIIINNIGALLLTTALVASCNQEELPSASGQKEVVKITASIGAGPGSRVTRTEDNYAFEQGDAFHIVGWYGESANTDTWFNDAVCTYSDTQWTAQPMLYWQNGENLTHHFLAWYPESFADTTKLDAIPFELSGDEEKDDVLYAKWSGTQPDNNTLPLAFNHLMARFDLNLVFNSEDYPTTPTGISAQIEVVNTATIDLLADSPAFTPGSTKTEVSLKGKSSLTEGMAWSGYTVVIPRQDINACKVTLSFTADDEQKSLTYTHGESLLFQSGKRTVLNLTVKKIDVLTFEGITVADWNEKESINAGEAEDMTWKNGFNRITGEYEPAQLNADGYYEIKNGGNLFWFANHVNTADRTANAVLTADIDLEGRPWTPIGSTGEANNNFRGVFDGQNYTIRGLNVEGGRAGLGFFGEVRTGTVKNFTIYGEVVVNTEVDYVGGVIGSICGLNGENDLERNGAVIQNITSYVNLTAKVHGPGMIGGFVGYANHQSLIEKCSWYGTFDAGEYRVDSGAGGFIGKIQENSSEVTIRNCAAYGTIKTNYAKNSYNNTATIYMGGFLSFSNTNAKTTLENCLFAGKFERGANLTDEARLGAFGTLRSVNAIKNCYYLAHDGLEAVHSDSDLDTNSDNVEIIEVTEDDLRNNTIATQLGGSWTQGENYPVIKK